MSPDGCLAGADIQPANAASKRPIRLLVLSHLYPSPSCPAHGIFIHQHVRALLDLGLQVRVLCPVPWPPPGLRSRPQWQTYARVLLESGPFDGVSVQRLPYLTGPRPLHVFGGLGLALSLRHRLPRLRPQFPFDLIHAHTLTPDGWAACLAAGRFSIPVVCSIRGSDLNLYPQESRITRRATRYVLSHSASILAVSGALAEQARIFSRGAVSPRVIYNGVNQSRFYRNACGHEARSGLGIPRGAWVLLFVGGCAADKGVPELVHAFEALRRRHGNLHLALVGEGELLGWVRQRAATQGWANALTAPGKLTHERVADFCRASDCFAFPSHAEGMPNALLEAMACGLPCVATRVGGIPEALEHAVSGLLVPPKHVTALAAAVGRILTEPGLAPRLGSEAAATIVKRFSWHANAQAHKDVYAEVMRAGEGAPVPTDTHSTPSHG